MPASLRHIKRRIKSVENTKKITKAMEMVAASKLKKYQDLLGQTRLYAARLERMLGNLISSSTSFKHPFFEIRESKKVLIYVVASDSGLCGSYNYNMFQMTERFLSEHSQKKSFFAIGKQAASYLRRKKYNLVDEIGIPKPQEIKQVLNQVLDYAKHAFLEKDYDEVYLIYTDYISMASYKPKVEKLFPLEGLPGQDQEKNEIDYIFEPGAEQILEKMIPHYLTLKVDQALKGALVSEQVSRMMAMRQATDNAVEMIDSLTLQRNKARQAAITKELIEVVSGSKAQQAK